MCVFCVRMEMPLSICVHFYTSGAQNESWGVRLMHSGKRWLLKLKMYWITSNYGLYSWIKYDSDAKCLSAKRFYNFIFCTHDSLLLLSLAQWLPVRFSVKVFSWSVFAIVVRTHKKQIWCVCVVKRIRCLKRNSEKIPRKKNPISYA